MDQAATDLARSAEAVHDGARTALAAASSDAASALRLARPPYAYRYAGKVAATARASKPRDTAGKVTASVRVGGRRQVFSGGATVSDVLWGAEFGAKGGDLVRVRTASGRSQSVDVSRFHAYQRRTSAQWVGTDRKGRRRAVKAGTAGATRNRVTHVRRGGLRQFPARQADGWFLTPTLDDAEAGTWQATDAAFRRALEGVNRGRS